MPPYDAESFKAGLAVGRALWRPQNRLKQLPPCLIFSSPSEFTLAIYNGYKRWSGKIEYSTDFVTWRIWDGTTALSSSNGRLCLRGSGNRTITMGYSSSRFVLNGENIACFGNIESLLNYTAEPGTHPSMNESCFAFLFYGCTCLVRAPALQAITLRPRCYSSMFRGCTALVSAPALPATTIAYQSYDFMFYGCTSLIKAPDILPAMNVHQESYLAMFEGCTRLINPPALPAISIDDRSYMQMFRGCTSLVRLPELPACTLGVHSYSRMFEGCTSIKVSASRNEEYKYSYRIPTTGTGSDNNNALTEMFTNTGGTFHSTPSINTTYYTTNPPILAI